MPTPVTRPSNLQIPFANSGTKNAIPVPSQIGIVNGQASYTDGFPPLTMTPLAAGGTPPLGQDFNGILNAMSAHTVFQNAGGRYRFDATLAAAIGGYPVGFVLQSNDGLSEYVNILAANSTDFNSTPAAIGVSWMPYSGGMSASLASPGYEKHANGIIFQWGTGSFSGASDTQQNFNYPIAFPSSVFIVAGSIGSLLGNTTLGFGSYSLTQYQVGYHSATGAAASSTGYSWIAIGK